MIKLEYDQPTAGVRVSFVVHDSVGIDTQAFSKQRRHVNGACMILQTPETLEIVKTMLEQVLEQANNG